MERRVKTRRILPGLQWLVVVSITTIATVAIAQESRQSCQLAQFQSAALPTVERVYALACQLEQMGRPDCVEHYYRTAILSWPAVEQMAGSHVVSSQQAQAWAFYHAALTRLLVVAQRYGRWDPRHGLTVASSSGLHHLSASYQGFPWKPGDFNQLVPVGEDNSHKVKASHLTHYYRTEGLGVTLVVHRQPSTSERFLPHDIPFAATVVLRPRGHDGSAASELNDSQCCPTDCPEGLFGLVFYNPLRFSSLAMGDRPTQLALDLSAPMSHPPKDSSRDWLRNFLQPGATANNDGLFMIEPYQRGKIPLVFVHGLLSEPSTWANIANEIRARQNLIGRYQIWAFRYDTGEPFLKSAAVLRRHLQEMRMSVDPERNDPALSRIVLIGHSMGGLVAKLQVTCSGDLLWQSAASRPFGQVIAAEEQRRELAEAFFFNPSLDVARVLFIGTPHRGSILARRLVGRLGSALVRPPRSKTEQHDQLIRNNPGVFRNEIIRRIPTSVDLLEPSSSILNATDRLPYRPGIVLHSIVGIGRQSLMGSYSDGVVSLDSARLGGVQSEKAVRTTHEKLHRAPDSVDEVLRILNLHSGSSRQCLLPGRSNFRFLRDLESAPNPLQVVR
jgi:pimeloyl-ACP methyl ester carboxylesterase